ncbi:hypothetical protein PVAND_006343 [Polypedilum vanderplanki]|uniref:Uncharacterized protein n=1 Tax=Polypedilum vanderplanki TaxID=319348 RepID=A0A9J6C2X0_POLVA|nr:hypothetical protein PVAND_006343 [Polypedilum vanderplanki]
MAFLTSSRIIFYTFGMLCLILAVACRPQNTIDSQDASDQDSSTDIRRLYNAYNSYPNPNGISPEERMALNRLQYEMMANYVQNNMPAVNGGWSDQLYRSPEIKRQVRYRQCYFNPISCFKK